MDETCLDKEKQALLKSLGMKTLDLLVKIAPIPDLAKEGYKSGREISKASKTFDTLGDGDDWIKSSDYSINKISALSHHLLRETASLSRMDENWWMKACGANLLDEEQTTQALQLLQQQRQFLLDLREACEGLKVLAWTAFAATNANVKGIARMYMPSLVAIDAAVTKESAERFEKCIKAINATLAVVENVIRSAADMERAIDRFLSLVNSSDQRKALDAMKTAQGRGAGR